MSVETIEVTEPDLSHGDGDQPDDLFHIAATEADDRNAEAGLPWVTLCGQRRGPARDTREMDLDAPDDCIVCVELYSGAIFGGSDE